MRANDEVFNMTKTYLQVILFFPAFMMNDVLLCFVRNDGNPRLAMTAMLLGSLSNIIMDYIFIFPLQMGIFSCPGNRLRTCNKHAHYVQDIGFPGEAVSA